MRTHGETAEDGVPVVGGRVMDLAEDEVGEGEVAGGRYGTELHEPGAGSGELEVTRCKEMGLKLLNVEEGVASLCQCFNGGHSIGDGTAMDESKLWHSDF